MPRDLNFCPHISLLASMTVSICDIDKIAYTILHGDIKCTFVVDYLGASMRTIKKLDYLL